MEKITRNNCKLMPQTPQEWIIIGKLIQLTH